MFALYRVNDISLERRTVMLISKLSQFVSKCWDAQVVPMISGSPGLAKSSVVRQLCDAKGYRMVDIRCSMLEPTDFRGLPFVQDGAVCWGKPSQLPPNDGTVTVLFLDEFTQANKQVQAACLQLVLDRSFGDFKLPDNTLIVLAGNKSSDRAGCTGLISPMANRLCIVEVEMDLDSWMPWAYANGIRKEVTGFIEMCPQHLSPGVPKVDGTPFPTPRSWEMLSRFQDPDYDIINGLIGPGVAPSYWAWLSVFGKFDLPAMLANPAGCEIPEGNDIRYAITAGLSERSMNATDSQLDSCVTLATRMTPEFAAMYFKSLFAKDPKSFVKKMLKIPTYVKWSKDHQDMLRLMA